MRRRGRRWSNACSGRTSPTTSTCPTTRCWPGWRRRCGLDAGAAAEALATGAGADQVRAEEAQATELGISAVPTFVIEGRWAIPGAQDVDTFLKILGTAAERLAPLPPHHE